MFADTVGGLCKERGDGKVEIAGKCEKCGCSVQRCGRHHAQNEPPEGPLRCCHAVMQAHMCQYVERLEGNGGCPLLSFGICAVTGTTLAWPCILEGPARVGAERSPRGAVE